MTHHKMSAETARMFGRLEARRAERIADLIEGEELTILDDKVIDLIREVDWRALAKVLNVLCRRA